LRTEKIAVWVLRSFKRSKAGMPSDLCMQFLAYLEATADADIVSCFQTRIGLFLKIMLPAKYTGAAFTEIISICMCHDPDSLFVNVLERPGCIVAGGLWMNYQMRSCKKKRQRGAAV
jgi:hypothetical protein